MGEVWKGIGQPPLVKKDFLKTEVAKKPTKLIKVADSRKKAANNKTITVKPKTPKS